MNSSQSLIKFVRMVLATVLYIFIDLIAVVMPFVLMAIPFVAAYLSKHVLPSKDIQMILFIIAFIALFMIAERSVRWSRSLQTFFRIKTQKIIETIGGEGFLKK